MIPRGAGNGTSRSRLVSLCSTYWEFWSTCVRKNAASHSTNPMTTPAPPTAASRAPSFGWTLTAARSGSASGSGSCGLRFEQRPHDGEGDDTRDRGHRTRERSPHEHLLQQLDATLLMVGQHVDDRERPSASKKEEAVERQIVGEERRLQPRGAETHHAHRQRPGAKGTWGQRIGCEPQPEPDERGRAGPHAHRDQQERDQQKVDLCAPPEQRTQRVVQQYEDHERDRGADGAGHGHVVSASALSAGNSGTVSRGMMIAPPPFRPAESAAAAARWDESSPA